MPSYNKVILMGNLTRDPEVRFLPSNTAVCNFSLAVNERYKDKEGNWQDKAHFVDCEAWGKTAENIGKFFAKGRPILIEGRLSLDQWDDKQSGQKRSKLKVVAETFEFVGPKPGGSGEAPAERGERSERGGGERGNFSRGSGRPAPAAQEAPPEMGQDGDIPF